jgi:hypothetical protein
LRIEANPRGGAIFDAAQFTLPALGTMGNARRRFFSGPGMENLDEALSRSFPVRDDRSLEFRVGAFNLINQFTVLRRFGGGKQHLRAEASARR